MTANEFFRTLNQSARNHQDGSDAFVNSKRVEFCRKLLNADISIDSLSDAFLYCAAINYLNVAVKQGKSIGYWFKSCVQTVIAECLNKRIPGIRFYLTSDSKGSVVYALFAECFSFSFHSPSFANDDLKRYLLSSRPIDFDGVRKQKCPNLILENAINLAQHQVKRESAPSRPSPRPAPKPRQAYAEDPAPRPQHSYSPAPSGGLVYEVHCSVPVYPIAQIIADFQLNRLVGNPKIAENIAVVISSVHFYKDLINSPNSVPDHIRKEMFREIITQTYSVVEAVEVEIGRRIAKQRSIKPKKKETDMDKQKRYKKLCHAEYGFDPATKDLYKEYKELRNNVHLCKDQQIINDDYYTEEATKKWYSFMEQYLSFLAK